MKGKIAFVLGAAVGYVLGSRAGRERYEQIKRGAKNLWNTDPVQNGVSVVKDAVDERADDLKAFAVRVGNDVFSNLAQQGKRSDPFSTTDDAADASGSGSSKSGSTSKSTGSRPSGASAKSGQTKSKSTKSASSKSTSSKSTSSNGKAGS